MTAGWPVAHHREAAAAFHARPFPDTVRRQVWVCEPTGPALVLGSAQRDEVVDRPACAAAGVPVVRRRSGGGAVLVEPGALLWVDVLLPATDALWRADVGAAFHWLGDAWAGALGEVGVAATVHRGGLVRSRWSSLVCFAGLGPGELTDATGAKVVGISQRRTRAGARFQCAVLLAPWDPRPLLGLLALTPGERAAAAADLATVVAGVGAPDRPADAGAVLGALVRHLP